MIMIMNVYTMYNYDIILISTILYDQRKKEKIFYNSHDMLQHTDRIEDQQ